MASSRKILDLLSTPSFHFMTTAVGIAAITIYDDQRYGKENQRLQAQQVKDIKASEDRLARRGSRMTEAQQDALFQEIEDRLSSPTRKYR